MGDRKVQARYLPGGTELGKTPQRRFRLTRSSLRFQDNQLGARLYGSDDGLRRVWRELGEVVKPHRAGGARVSIAKTDCGDGSLRILTGDLVVIEVQRIRVVEESSIGADPVRKCCKPRNEVMEPRVVRKGSTP